MRNYAERYVFVTEELELHARATKLLEALGGQLTETQRFCVRCHEVTHAMGRVLGLTVVNGHVVNMEHSWLTTRQGSVLDVWATNRVPSVQLVASCSDYREYSPLLQYLGRAGERPFDEEFVDLIALHFRRTLNAIDEERLYERVAEAPDWSERCRGVAAFVRDRYATLPEALELHVEMRRGIRAVYSADRRYRYFVEHMWAAGEPRLVLVARNPETHAFDADPDTVRRVTALAKREHCGGFVVVGLHALVADVGALRRAYWPVGEHNPAFLDGVFADVRPGSTMWGPVVAAWGDLDEVFNERASNVVTAVTSRGRVLYCAGRTRRGNPRATWQIREGATLESYKAPSVVTASNPDAPAPAPQPGPRPGPRPRRRVGSP